MSVVLLIPILGFWAVCASCDRDPEEAEEVACEGEFRDVRASDYRRGTDVYLEGELYGTISALELRRQFPDGTAGRAVQVSFPDGSRSWFRYGSLRNYGYEVACP